LCYPPHVIFTRDLSNAGVQGCQGKAMDASDRTKPLTIG
jgi:hypothetical protein